MKTDLQVLEKAAPNVAHTIITSTITLTSVYDGATGKTKITLTTIERRSS